MAQNNQDENLNKQPIFDLKEWMNTKYRGNLLNSCCSLETRKNTDILKGFLATLSKSVCYSRLKQQKQLAVNIPTSQYKTEFILDQKVQWTYMYLKRMTQNIESNHYQVTKTVFGVFKDKLSNQPKRISKLWNCLNGLFKSKKHMRKWYSTLKVNSQFQSSQLKVQEFSDKFHKTQELQEYFTTFRFIAKNERSFKILYTLKSFESLKLNHIDCQSILIQEKYLDTQRQLQVHRLRKIVFIIFKQNWLISRTDKVIKDNKDILDIADKYNLETYKSDHLKTAMIRATKLIKWSLERTLLTYIDQWKTVCRKSIEVSWDIHPQKKCFPWQNITLLLSKFYMRLWFLKFKAKCNIHINNQLSHEHQQAIGTGQILSLKKTLLVHQVDGEKLYFNYNAKQKLTKILAFKEVYRKYINIWNKKASLRTTQMKRVLKIIRSREKSFQRVSCITHLPFLMILL